MCRVVKKLIQNIQFSLGATICAALDDPDVVEVFLNPDGKVWIEKCGIMMPVDTLAPDKALQAISVIASSLHTLVNEESPIVGGELIIDGSRFEGMIPPVSEADASDIEVVVKNDRTSADAGLTGGLSIAKLKICMERENESLVWVFALNGLLEFSGLKVPAAKKSKDDDQDAVLLEKLYLVEQAVGVIHKLFGSR